MHELAAMQDILERVNKEAKIKGAKKVLEIKIKIGELRGLSRGHFLDDWKMLIKGSWLEGTKIDIEMIPPRAHCKICRKDLSLDKFSINCPSCGAPEIEITAGKELRLESIIVE